MVFTRTYLEFWCDVDEVAFFRLCVEKNLLNNAIIMVLVTQLVHVALLVDAWIDVFDWTDLRRWTQKQIWNWSNKASFYSQTDTKEICDFLRKAVAFYWKIKYFQHHGHIHFTLTHANEVGFAKNSFFLFGLKVKNSPA